MEQSEAPRFTFALKRGTILAGRYRIDRLLADSSSFALTYLATDTSVAGDSQVRVAVKEFLPRVLVGRSGSGNAVQPHSPADGREFARSLQRFLRESEVLGGIDSPYLTRVHRCVQENGTGYVVMAPRAARPLPTALSEVTGGCISAGDAVTLVVRLLEVLEKLHAQGVFHRAISLDAVAVTDKWQPVLHGFSARRHVTGEPPVLIPGYAAFEQYASGDIGPWTDVYACSALLYQLVAGVAPPAAVHRAVGKPLAPAGWLTPDVSSALSSAIARGLSLMPEQRPIGAAEFRQELESAASHADASDFAVSSAGLETVRVATPPSIDADFGPHTPIAATSRTVPMPAGAHVTPRFARLLGRINEITDRVREGLRPASALLRTPRRLRLGLRAGDAMSVDSLPGAAKALLASMGQVEKQKAARYVSAAILTLVVAGSAYAIFARSRADDLRRAELQAADMQLATASLGQPPSSAPRPVVGAVQQGVAVAPDSAHPKPASRGSDQRQPESSKPNSPSVPTLPTLKRVNVPASFDAEKELVPVDVVLDLRTQLSNGQQQADEGQYALARRILASAMTSAGSAINRFSGSKTLRSIRAELDSADRRVLTACQAENDVLRKRGGTAVSCQ